MLKEFVSAGRLELVSFDAKFFSQQFESCLQSRIDALNLLEDQGFDIRFFTVTMFNIMFVYYDLVDEDKISADDYRAMLVNQIRNSARNTVSS